MNKAGVEKPEFEIEQEYTLVDRQGKIYAFKL